MFQLPKDFDVHNRQVIISIGLCLSSTCRDQDVINIFKAFRIPITVVAISCYNSSVQYLDSSAIAIITVLLIFVLLFTLGTLVEVFSKFQADQISNSRRIKSKNAYILGLLSFAGISNSRMLFSADQKGSIGCIHGLRVLTMAWVILVHVSVFTLNKSWNNILDSFAEKSNFLNEITYSTIAVDTFFCIRYIRLTPVYAISIGITAGLLPYFGSGPNWGYVIEQCQMCKQNWWQHLLYISNMFDATMCQSHTWFLAADMQLYILAPLILYPLHINKYIGATIAIILGASCIIATALITYFYDFPANFHPTSVNSAKTIEDFQKKLYLKPYFRGGPYIIGLMTGYALSFQEEISKFFNKKVAFFGWLAATVCNLSALFGFHKYISDGTIPSLTENCLYNALARTGWAIGIAWIILACSSGYGGPINWILSWRIFIPLAKLTYCVYIFHLNIIMLFLMSRRSTMNYDFWMAINIFLAMLVLSNAVAISFTLLFEIPILRLQSISFRGKKKEVNNRPVNANSVNENPVKGSPESGTITQHSKANDSNL